jgi:translation initiation factor IF-3
MIRIPQVRVVDEEGAQLGVMPTPKALEMAQERGLDLVEVAPMAAPPVVKFLDFGQYKYDLTKREKEAKRKQRSVTFKEIRLSPKIGVGDFDTKVHRAIEFLEDGDRIKVTVRFRGRELTHPELGRNMIARFVERVKDHGVPERTPLLEGKSMHITMASLHKAKGHDGTPSNKDRPASNSAPIETETARPSGDGEAPGPAAAPTMAGPAEAAAAKPAAAKPAAAAGPAEAKPATAKSAAPAKTKTDSTKKTDKGPAPQPVTTGE